MLGGSGTGTVVVGDVSTVVGGSVGATVTVTVSVTVPGGSVEEVARPEGVDAPDAGVLGLAPAARVAVRRDTSVSGSEPS